MSKLVTGIFQSREEAEQAADDLVLAGFSADDVSLLMTDSTRGREFAVRDTNKAPEAGATGAMIGGALGAVAAGLMATATIAVPGLALVAAGPLVAALAGLGVGATAGGMVGALVGLGIPEHEAKFYSEEIEKGGILLGVYAHKDRVGVAREVLKSAGANKVT